MPIPTSSKPDADIPFHLRLLLGTPDECGAKDSQPSGTFGPKAPPGIRSKKARRRKTRSNKPDANLSKAINLREAVKIYQECEEDLRKAYALLVSVQERLSHTFGAESRYFSVTTYNPDFENPEGALKGIKRNAWAALVDRMGIKTVMSVARAKELEEQLDEKYKGDLPDITFENVISTLKGMHDQIPVMAKEAVVEVFEFLRPPRNRFKTNKPFEIGNRVIIPRIVHMGWQTYAVDYSDKPSLRALENVFSYLDGKGFADRTFQGVLVEAIEKTSPRNNEGRTEYFRFKTHQNGNLHIEFLRPDLVEELNRIAGGNRLKA